MFKDELRTLKDVQITILVDPTIKPKYYRAHPVPYTLTVMQFKKQLINDRLRVSDISSKFRILTTYYYAVIFSWNLKFSEKIAFFLTVTIVFFVFININLQLDNLKSRTAMYEKISVFVICVVVILYLILYNLHDCTFKK